MDSEYCNCKRCERHEHLKERLRKPFNDMNHIVLNKGLALRIRMNYAIKRLHNLRVQSLKEWEELKDQVKAPLGMLLWGHCHGV